VTFEPRFIRYRYVDSQAFRKGVKKEEPENIVVFLIVAPHEIAYGKK